MESIEYYFLARNLFIPLNRELNSRVLSPRMCCHSLNSSDANCLKLWKIFDFFSYFQMIRVKGKFIFSADTVNISLTYFRHKGTARIQLCIFLGCNLGTDHP